MTQSGKTQNKSHQMPRAIVVLNLNSSEIKQATKSNMQVLKLKGWVQLVGNYANNPIWVHLFVKLGWPKENRFLLDSSQNVILSCLLKRSVSWENFSPPRNTCITF